MARSRTHRVIDHSGAPPLRRHFSALQDETAVTEILEEAGRRIALRERRGRPIEKLHGYAWVTLRSVATSRMRLGSTQLIQRTLESNASAARLAASSAVLGSVEQIESDILLREVLAQLSPDERLICVWKKSGFSSEEIHSSQSIRYKTGTGQRSALEGRRAGAPTRLLPHLPFVAHRPRPSAKCCRNGCLESLNSALPPARELHRASARYGRLQVEVGLHVHPELRCRLEELRQAERRGGSHPTFAPDELVEPHGRHSQLQRGRGLRYLEWLQQLLEKNLSGMNGRSQTRRLSRDALSGSPHSGRRTHRCSPT